MKGPKALEDERPGGRPALSRAGTGVASDG
jgi:hypothetical protein